MQTHARQSERRTLIEDSFQHRALRSALELRYRVYCLEYGFLAHDDYPSGYETDEYDSGAAHFFAFDANEEVVGYVRLVRPTAGEPFPIERHCQLASDAQPLPPRARAAEISRLMVRDDYRRRRGDRMSGVTADQCDPLFGRDRRSKAPQILLNLYRQMYAYSLENDIGYWYAAMERPLARSLLRLHFAFRSIGPQTDYYGPVAPYLADLRELEAHLCKRHPELLGWMQQPERWFGESTHGDEWGLCHVQPAMLASLRTERSKAALSA